MDWSILATVGGPIAGLGVFMYGVAPLLVRRQFRLNPAGDIEYIDLGGPETPRKVREDVVETAAEFERLGFELVCFTRDAQSVPNVRGFTATFTNERERHIAMVGSIYATIKGVPVRTDRLVLFNSELEDGTEVVTRTGKTLPMGAPGGPRAIVFRRGREVADLYRLHLAHLHRFGSVGRRSADPERVISELEAGNAKLADRLVRSGWGWMGRDGQMRLTLRGAYQEAWRSVQPMKLLIRRRLDREAAELAREAGV